MTLMDTTPNQVPAATAAAAVTYALPAEPLRAAITTYYLVKVTGPGTVRDQIFPEWPNFRLILSGEWAAKFPDVDVEPVPMAGVTGALERAVWVEGSAGVMVGVGLMPQGWPRLTLRPADEFTNHMRPLADCLGPVSDTLHARLKAAAPQGDKALYAILDEVLGGLLVDAPEAELVASAHAALQDPGTQTVSDWAEAVGLSSRQLERFSLRYFGLSPKRLLRRQRVLRTLAAMRESHQATWSQSIDHQFTDQAHFIHEFNYYMGVSPSAYLARHQPIMAGAWKNRKALLGSPVQVLQPPSSPRA
jgi:AraC-like DNA-binding protein